MSAFIEPLDLRTIFVNYLTGNPEMFAFLAVIAISAGSAYFRMPDTIFLIMVALFVIFMAQYMAGLYLIVLVVTSLIIFYGIARVVK